MDAPDRPTAGAQYRGGQSPVDQLLAVAVGTGHQAHAQSGMSRKTMLATTTSNGPPRPGSLHGSAWTWRMPSTHHCRKTWRKSSRARLARLRNVSFCKLSPTRWLKRDRPFRMDRSWADRHRLREGDEYDWPPTVYWSGADWMNHEIIHLRKRQDG